MSKLHAPIDDALTPDFGPWFEGAPDAYLVLSPDLIVVGVNRSYARMVGVVPEKVIGRHVFDVFPENPAEVEATGKGILRASLERVLQHRVPDTMPVIKYDVQDDEGRFQSRFWTVTNTPVLDATGEVQWIINRPEDVSALRNLGLPITPAEIKEYARKTQMALASTEEQLRQAQKLEAVGRLAGGIAHDFNNMLSVILSTTGLLREDLPHDHSAIADLREIENAGLRAADLTRRLLAFSRQQVLDLRVLDLGPVVSEIQPMLVRLLGEDVEHRIKIDPAAGRIRGDKSQLEQLLTNLVVNSRDAMPTGGLLSIEVSNVLLSAEYAISHADVVPGNYVVLTVSDTGHGMDKATQERAFEPFFTTKPPGRGTGLGLSTVFGMVKQVGGFLWLYSEVGIGTTIKVYFPQVDAPSDEQARHALTAMRGGTEGILVLEDDEAVRHSVLRILTRLGYRAEGTGSPVEALVRVAKEGPAPDLLITDVVMPEMNGRVLAERARKIVPGLKVLFISGYTDDVVLQHGILATGVPYLQKPITPESLARQVREVLDGA